MGSDPSLRNFLNRSLNTVQGAAVDDAVAGDEATVRVKPGHSFSVREHSAGALKDESRRGNIPDPQIQMPVGVHAPARDIAYSKRR